MTNRILVTYASRTGTTAGVADAIAKVLADSNLQVDLLPMRQLKDLSVNQAVVAGSAIQAAQWLPEAVQFIQDNQAALQGMPAAIFSVCMTLAMPNGEKYRPGVMDWIQPVRQMANPFIEGLFAGALDLKQVPKMGDRLKFKISVAMGVWKEGDHRDWTAIRAWADSLITRL